MTNMTLNQTNAFIDAKLAISHDHQFINDHKEKDVFDMYSDVIMRLNIDNSLREYEINYTTTKEEEKYIIQINNTTSEQLNEIMRALRFYSVQCGNGAIRGYQLDITVLDN